MASRFPAQEEEEEDSDDSEEAKIAFERPEVSRLLVEAERWIEVAEFDLGVARSALQLHCDEKAGKAELSLEARLLELHIQQSQKEVQWSSHLNPCSNLLSVLCQREHPTRLVLHLHPDSYSLHLRLKDRGIELLKDRPYEEEDFLLECVDNQELPAFLVDLLEECCEEDVFYSGCIITEVRDSRRNIAAAAACSVSHVLLRPTTQSIICDSHILAASSSAAANGSSNSSNEQASLEGQLALTSHGPLCLDPSPVVSFLARKSEVARKKFNCVPLRRAAKRYSKLGSNRKRKLEELQCPKELKLLDFLSSSKRPRKAQEALAKHQAATRARLRSGATAAAASLTAGAAAAAVEPPITALDQNDALKFARCIQRRQEVNDMTPNMVEEYILETAERGVARIYHTRLTIYQRPANDEYLGELYVERDYKEGDNKGSTCRFVLGTRPHALRYINQFTEIFTEEGRKSVKITHRVPNQQPRVTYTQGMRERMTDRAANNSNGVPQRVVVAAAAGSATPVPVAAPATPPVVVSNGPVALTLQQQPTVLQKKPLPSPSILQQQLSAPPAASPNSHPTAAATAAAQLPLHPLPHLRPNSGSSILQGQLTIQTLQLPLTPVPPQPSPLPSPVQQQQQQDLVSDQQEKAISAIMQSLMQDTAKFEADNSSSKSPSSGGGGTNNNVQLPTRPVPQASLKQPTKLIANRVSLQNLLQSQSSKAAAAASTGMPQLSAQLARPPSYTQAVMSSSRVVQLNPQPSIIRRQSSEKLSLSQDHALPGLHSLLANAPSADSNPAELNLPAATATSAIPSSSSLLERLVSSGPQQSLLQQQQQRPQLLQTVATTNHNSDGGGIAAAADSTQEITLATILAKPPISSAPGSRPGTPNDVSPAKSSPLLQQLQQPVQQSRMMATSPRTSFTQSPRATPSALQQHLMQPPRNNQQQQQSILSATLQQQPVVVVQQEQQNGGNGQSVVSLQNLLQSGVVQVSNSHNQQSGGANVSGGNMVQLQIPGLSSPVTLSVNLQQGGGHNNQQQQQDLILRQQNSPIVTSIGGHVVFHQQQPNIVAAGSNNYIQLPQQPTKSGGGGNNLVKSNQVLQVRQGQQGQVFLQMPSSSPSQQQQQVIGNSNPIQIVRANQRQQFVLKSPPATPSPSSSSSVTSPPPVVIAAPQPSAMPPDSPLLMQANELKQQQKLPHRTTQRKQSLK